MSVLTTFISCIVTSIRTENKQHALIASASYLIVFSPPRKQRMIAILRMRILRIQVRNVDDSLI